MSWLLLGIPIGIILLYYGSEWMVDGAKKMALRLGVTPFVVGLTVVAFGSSAPEAITSLVSSANPQIIVGNIVGSNIANIGLAIALAAIISPIICSYKQIRFELISMLISTAVITVMALRGSLGWVEGIILVVSLFIFVGAVYYLKKDAPNTEKVIDPDILEDEHNTTPIWISCTLVIVGIVVLYFGAQAFIKGAVELSSILGVSDLLVGLLVVAVGTSLPELCICLVAAYRHENELVVSNIVGSIVFNCFFALGIGLLFTTVPITHYMLVFHMPVMILMTVLMYMIIKSGNKIKRSEGVLLFAIYMIYLALMVIYPELTQSIM